MVKVTPTLNETVGEANWKVYTQNAKKNLAVATENRSEDAVIKLVEKAGYQAEKLS